MERMYVEKCQGPAALLQYIKTGNARYQWRCGLINGVPNNMDLYCGASDRKYWARKVHRLTVTVDDKGDDVLAWEERTRPDLSDVHDAIFTKKAIR